jgi:hypothetical protein
MRRNFQFISTPQAVLGWDPSDDLIIMILDQAPITYMYSARDDKIVPKEGISECPLQEFLRRMHLAEQLLGILYFSSSRK